ncbi:MAG: hypothetical protein J3K34DRAFT_400931, partial [Monoraphidium minutum]
MLRRERSGDATGRGLLRLHPMWLCFEAPGGFLFYMHRAAPHYLTTRFWPAPVGGTCGGFLCDYMGLGKTLQMLLLTLAHPAPADWVADPATHGLDESSPCPIKTTLLVMPSNLIAQWKACGLIYI